MPYQIRYLDAEGMALRTITLQRAERARAYDAFAALDLATAPEGAHTICLTEDGRAVLRMTLPTPAPAPEPEPEPAPAVEPEPAPRKRRRA